MSTQLRYKRHADPAINEAHERFLTSIQNYEGDDPLSLWIPYVEWAQDTFVEEEEDDDLFSVLDACLKAIMPLPQYKSNKRFLKVCVLVAEMSEDPSAFFEQLRVRGIGTGLTLFYQAYALILEADGDIAGADRVYMQGFENHAEPWQDMVRAYSLFKAKHQALAPQVSTPGPASIPTEVVPKQQQTITAQPQRQSAGIAPSAALASSAPVRTSEPQPTPAASPVDEGDLSLEERRARSAKYTAYRGHQLTAHRVIRHWKNGQDVTKRPFGSTIPQLEVPTIPTSSSEINVAQLDVGENTAAFGTMFNMFNDLAGGAGNVTQDFSATALFKSTRTQQPSKQSAATSSTGSSPTICTRKALADVDGMFGSKRNNGLTQTSSGDLTTNFITTSLTMEMRRSARGTGEPNPCARPAEAAREHSSNPGTTPLRVGVLTYEPTVDAKAFMQTKGTGGNAQPSATAAAAPIEIDYDLFATTQDANGLATFGLVNGKSHSELDLQDATGDVTRFNMAKAQLLAAQKQKISVEVFCDENFDSAPSAEPAPAPKPAAENPTSSASLGLGRKRGLGLRATTTSDPENAPPASVSQPTATNSPGPEIGFGFGPSSAAPPSTIKRRRSQFQFSRISDENAFIACGTNENAPSAAPSAASNAGAGLQPRRKGLSIVASSQPVLAPATTSTPSAKDPGKPPLSSSRRPSAASPPNTFASQAVSMLQRYDGVTTR